MKRTIATFVIALLVPACSPAPPAHTSQWYADHPPEAAARVQACDRLALSERDADCANAANGELMAVMRPRKNGYNPWK